MKAQFYPQPYYQPYYQPYPYYGGGGIGGIGVPYRNVYGGGRYYGGRCG